MIYSINLGLFLFNMLIPMFPMDAGRTLQCLLWIKLGYRRAMLITTTVGLITGGLMIAAGLALQQSNLTFIAILGMSICWSERQRIKFLEASGEPEEEENPYAESLAWREKDDRAYRAAVGRQQREQADTRAAQAEEDRILSKIATQGMQSLTRAEKRALEEATKRRRGA